MTSFIHCLHTDIKRLTHLYLGSGHTVEQQGSRHSYTSYDAVLHLPETHQERHKKGEKVQLYGG